MPRIGGIEVPNNKRLEVALTYIYGIGPTRAKQICKASRLDPNMRAKDLSDKDIGEIRDSIERLKFMVEGELRSVVMQNVKRLQDIRCFRGVRHLKKLPSRGQNTRHNARTRRGKRQTVGGMKKVLAKK